MLSHSLPRRGGQSLLFGSMCVGSMLACADCDRAGCDALTYPAAQNETGIAGVVAALSDVVKDGCGECPLGEAALQIWSVDAPPESDAAARTLLQTRRPDLTILASKNYSQALNPGRYLICVRPNCIELEVANGETATVNVKRRDGPTGFFTGGPASPALQETLGYDVGY